MAGNPRSAADSRGRPNWAAGFVLLNRKRQEVFRPVLENPRALVLLNVRELAGKLKVDPATVVRVVSKLDFVNYREFQRYLHELFISKTTSLDSMQTTKAITRSRLPEELVKWQLRSRKSLSRMAVPRERDGSGKGPQLAFKDSSNASTPQSVCPTAFIILSTDGRYSTRSAITGSTLVARRAGK